MTNDSKTMFEKIRAFLTVYMPKQRGLSNCTIDSYRQVINQFLGFIMEKKGIPYDEMLSGKLNDAPSGRLFRADFRTLQMCQSL